ncbi:SAYSvFN domain-containing protein 1 [Onthophagus taurus]|uniref:SAYSvFN domain-containing protein 1 n=1 Tax=Onthophagus taurus TaxID=166361 RepID=UPI000C208DB7|nr:SAYSvFN domain-containing protein 1 [Onthophagus taurus]
MEQKLANYRQRQERQVYLDKTKQRISNFFNTTQSESKTNNTFHEEEHNPESETLLINDTQSETSITSDDDNINCCTRIDLLYYFLLFLIWATLYVIFIEYQFGTIYLILSALIGIYLNTRTKPKRPGEISAYSVFNRNCKSIDGTLKAEQFEREIRYGSYGLLHV